MRIVSVRYQISRLAGYLSALPKTGETCGFLAKGDRIGEYFFASLREIRLAAAQRDEFRAHRIGALVPSQESISRKAAKIAKKKPSIRAFARTSESAEVIFRRVSPGDLPRAGPPREDAWRAARAPPYDRGHARDRARWRSHLPPDGSSVPLP